ncbi:SprB repeat-containing protein, partial [Phaeodactylibacter sp.]|uniref:SprB repeat-containing protein n=1 Tax=Phaeodactylibacter sp. TaxID=1940289 RepID=UPI0025CCA126
MHPKFYSTQQHYSSKGQSLIAVFRMAVLLSVGLFCSATLQGQNVYYWVNGSGDWSDAPNHWAASSGGTNFYTSVPTESDIVIFDANSFNAPNQVVNMDVDGTVGDLDMTTVDENFIINGMDMPLRVRGNMELTNQLSFSSPLNFIFTSNATQSINTAGVVLPDQVRFEGLGTYNMQSDIVAVGIFDFLSGTLNTNNFDITVDRVASGNGVPSSGSLNINTRVLNLGTSEINTFGGFGMNPENLTVNGPNSTLNIGTPSSGGVLLIFGFGTGNNSVVNLGTVNLTSSGLSEYWSTSGVLDTIKEFNIIGRTSELSNAGADFIGKLTMTVENDIDFGANPKPTVDSLIVNNPIGETVLRNRITVNNFEMIADGSCTAPLRLEGFGPSFGANVGNVTINDVEVNNSTVTGLNTYTLNDVAFDGSGNVGWVINRRPEESLYWIGGSGDWDDPANWSLTSGGPPNPDMCIPSFYTNVFFDANSFTAPGQTVNIAQEVDALCNNMDWVGANAPVFNNLGGVRLGGSLAFNSTVTVSSNQGSLNFILTEGNKTIDMDGVVLPNGRMLLAEGDFTLLDDIIMLTNNPSTQFGVLDTLRTSDFNITTDRIDVNGGVAFFGESVVTVTVPDPGNTSSRFFQSQVDADMACFVVADELATFEIRSTTAIGGGIPEFRKFEAPNGSLRLDFNDQLARIGTVRSLENMTLLSTNPPVQGDIIEIDSLDIIGTSGGNVLLVTDNGGTNNFFQFNEFFNIATSACPVPNEIRFTGDDLLFINNSGSTFTVEQVNLFGTRVTGGWVANDVFIEDGNNLGWDAINPPAAGVDYFWIGGTGDWEDPANWSLTSGVPNNPSNCLPSPIDDVYFDANSFANDGEIVRLNGSVSFNSMIWEDNDNADIRLSRNSGSALVNQFGSFVGDDGLVIDPGNGFTWLLRSLDPNNPDTLRSNGTTILNGGVNGLTLRLTGTGTYNVVDDWSESELFRLELNNGSFLANGNDLWAANFVIQAATIDSVNLDNATFFYGGAVNLGDNSLGKVSVDQTFFDKAVSDGTVWTIGPGYDIANIQDTIPRVNNNPNASSFTFNGDDLSIVRVLNIDPLFFNLNNGGAFDTLILSEKTVVAQLQSGATFEVNEYLFIDANGCLFSRLESDNSNQEAFLNVGAGATEDLNFLNITDINVSGSAAPPVPPGRASSDEGGNTGWAFSGEAFTTLPQSFIFCGVEGTSTLVVAPPDPNVTDFWYAPVSMPMDTFNTNDSTFVIETPDQSFLLFNFFGEDCVRTDTITFNSMDFSDGPASYGQAIHDGLDIRMRLGSVLDCENTPLVGGPLADADDIDRLDDEEGIPFFPPGSPSTTTYSVTLSLANDTTFATNLFAWIDWDQNGTFDEDERANVSSGSITVSGNQIPANTSQGTVILTWTGLSGLNIGDSYFVRVRITSDNIDLTADGSSQDDASFGMAVTGEVEDYLFINSCPEFVISRADVIQPICDQATGTINVNVSTPILGSEVFVLKDALTGAIVRPEQASTEFTGLAPGFYRVVGGFNPPAACAALDSIDVSVRGVLAPKATVNTITPANCLAADGAIDIDVTDGVAPFTFNWSNGAITEDISGLAGGTYVLELTDANGCTWFGAFEVPSDQGSLSATFTTSPATCGAAIPDGSIDVTPTGGDGNYTFNWRSGATTEDLMNLAAGAYFLTITDGNGCVAEVTPIVTNEVFPPINIDATMDAGCERELGGSITASSDLNSNIFIRDEAGNTLGLGSLSATATGLRAGRYLVTAINTSSCQNTIEVILDENDINAGIIANDQVLCVGDDPASLNEVQMASGDGALSYQWQSSSDVAGPYTDIPGATGINFDPTTVTGDTFFRRIDTSTEGGAVCPEPTNVLLLRTNDITAGTVGSDQVICEGTAPAPIVETTPAVADGTLTYQWQSSVNGGTTFTDIMGATSADLGSVGAVLQETLYRRIDFSTLNGVVCSDITNEVSVTFFPELQTVNTPMETCLAGGGGFTVEVDITGTPAFTVIGAGGPGTFTDNGNGTFTFVSEPLPLNAPTYSITIEDAAGCSQLVINGSSPTNCCSFDVVCPTFPSTTLQCYDEVPTATTLTEAAFEALGNGDGSIGDTPCGVIEITASNEADPGSCNTTVTRTYTITEYEDPNNNGVRDPGENTVLNTTTCTQDFILDDTTAPTITTSAADLTVECDGMGNMADLNNWLATNGGAAATDYCSSSVTFTNDFTALSNGCGATGSATVTFTATDDCGNTSTTTATFTIEDTTNPTVTDPATDLTVECDGMGNMMALNNWLSSNGGASFDDACGGITVTNDFTALSDLCGATGSATVTFTATDDCGNTATSTATFTIEDTAAPTVTTPASDLTVECDGAGNTAQLNAWL